VVVSDMNMAGMNGVRFLAKVREMAPDTTRIMLTGADRQTAIQAVNEGNIFRFLTKPCSSEMLEVTIEAAVTQHKYTVSERTLLSNTLTGAVKILTDVLALVRPVAFGRTDRIRGLVRWMATELAPQQLWRAELATMLSQVGCVGLPDDLLARAYTGKRLEPRELKAYAEHPRAGHDLVAHVPRLQPVAEIILQQGKCYNGSGFPQDGIAGDAIPIEARILKVALDFDSLVHSGKSTTDAFAILCSREGHYDKAVLALLQKSIALAAARQVMDVAMV
jgi:response regulator RpfG family c-di-GMP phosphodiesterase